jgi:biofilm PGA synthesis N-glycosyltransferase PgaC
MEALFITSAIILVYTFAIYPALMAFSKKEPTKRLDLNDDELPEVTVVLAVHNCSESVQDRIKNIYQSDYPLSKLKMIVVSDGSTDNTEHILIELSSKISSLSYIHYNINKGKAYAISRALKHVHTEFVAFCDVRQTFSKLALRNMANALANESVGAVTGNLIISEDNGNSQADPGLYWKYEKWIRDNESSRKSMLGVTGAIYMAKKHLLPERIPLDTILDDMYVPMFIIKNGHNVKMVNDAYAYDVPSSTLAEEFSRKVRTLAGNFQLMKLLPWLSVPVANPVFFEWFSHKFCRLLVPYAMVGLMVSSSVMNSYLFNGMFIFQWCFYLYALVSYLASNRQKSIKFGSVCLSFCTLNMAALIAGWKYLFLPTKALWHKH